ncbi:outer membrane putative beta-barrel porin/alpha-amylase [Roseivirga pacifica]|uniref:Putative MetA-pathway of phenol degradation n=1 Tax=Roseivirga pacifica TaxID=1267423 RepID=A0A1I0R9U5_9BACT|nr:transporter [Roseivirga pacifica]RKQ49278.1 outer membrane putative beta-barrel porin/alpha-amylase [Roseivirga pacifica]SEW37590.1 Putative MetA-pathway of phenol degradation [Roseivirga pacifica]
MRRTYLFIISLCLSSLLLKAQDGPKINTDRPSASESAYLLRKGDFQIETGFLYAEFNEELLGSDNIKIQAITLNSTALRYGVSDKFELKLTQGLNKVRVNYGDGRITSDVQVVPTLIGFKANIVELGESNTQLSFQGMVGGDLFMEDGEFGQADLRLMIDQVIADNFSVGGNVAARVLNGFEDTGFAYSVYGAASLSNAAGLYLEFFGSLFGDDAFLPDSHEIDAGFTYAINPTMQVDAMVGFGLSEFANDFTFGFGFSALIPHK